MGKASNKKQKRNSEKINVDDDDDIDNNSTTEVAKLHSTLKVKPTRRGAPRDSPSQRSSIYRGVTRHRWTGRYEAHLWDKDCWNDAQKKKGRQVYLGAYDDEAAAAHAYDLAALKYWGKETILNFPFSTYENEMKEMEGLSREEYIGSLRRRSNGFSRGMSKYRGVARHHHNGRWEARIGRVLGNKYLYLGTYATQEEAATAYDMAAIEYRGHNAVTNFDLSRYIKFLKPNNSCHDQPCPKPHVKATKSMDIDQVGHAMPTKTGDIVWDELSSIDYSSILLDLDEHGLLQFDSNYHSRYTYTEGRGSSLESSSSDDIRNNDDDFFSDLGSFLCDFDVVEDE